MEDMVKTLATLHALDAVDENRKLKAQQEQSAHEHRAELDSVKQTISRNDKAHRQALDSANSERDRFRRLYWAADKKARDTQESYEKVAHLLRQPLEKIAEADSGFRYNFTQFKAMHAAQMLQALALREQCEAYAQALGKSAADMTADIEAASQRVLSGQSPHAAAAMPIKKTIVEAQKLKRLHNS